MIYKIEQVSFRQIASLFRSARIGVFPTDTVYGIGCVPQKETLDRFYYIKKRDTKKPTALLIGDISQIENLVQPISLKVRSVMEKFWPGDLTIVLPENTQLDERIGYNGLVGIRFPKDTFLQKMISESGPLAVASANESSANTPYFYNEIQDEFLEKVDFVIKDESRKVAIEPSTVVKIIDSQITILRQGRITQDDLEKA